jgi:hypothetical protein
MDQRVGLTVVVDSHATRTFAFGGVASLLFPVPRPVAACIQLCASPCRVASRPVIAWLCPPHAALEVTGTPAPARPSANLAITAWAACGLRAPKEVGARRRGAAMPASASCVLRATTGTPSRRRRAHVWRRAPLGTTVRPAAPSPGPTRALQAGSGRPPVPPP